MKKIWILGLLLTWIINLIPSTSYATEDISVFVDNQKIQFTNDPFIEQGTTLVEFRPLFEKLGLNVEWDPTTQTVSGKKDGLSITLTINSKMAVVNDREIYLAVAPRIFNGYTLIPLRFVSEYSGQQVNWLESTRTIKISTKPINEKSIYLNDTKLTAESTADYLLGYFNVKIKNGIDTTQPITLGYLLGISKKDIYFDFASNTISYPTINVIISEANITMNNKVIAEPGLTQENGVSYIPIRSIVEALGGKYEEKEDGVYITLQRR